MTTESDALLGTVIGGLWRVTRKLGEGGMGSVYAVEGTSGQGERAIKLLHREFVKEEQVVSRFYAEAEASQRLDHPHIARVFESGKTAAGEPFLIMELLRGQPLADVNPDGQRMDVAEAMRVIQEVLLALTAAHAQEIVHRDLKPDNVFLCDQPDGGRRRAKLLDFGIARVIDAAGGGMRKTRTGMLLGTPGYMSPEQLRNSKSVDPRSDLWSLNTVFYELLSGRDPYGATNDFARLTAVFTQEAIPVDRDLPELAPWRPFFERAFARDINHRFQSAGEMSDVIAAIGRGEPMPAPQPPLGAATPAPVVPSPTGMAMATTTPAGFQLTAEMAGSPMPPAGSTMLSGPTSASPAHAYAPPGTGAHPVSMTGPTMAMPAISPEAMQASLTPMHPVSVPTPVNLSATPGSQRVVQAGSNRLVWALIGVVLVLGMITVALAIRSVQEDNHPAAPAPHPTAVPAKPGGKAHH